MEIYFFESQELQLPDPGSGPRVQGWVLQQHGGQHAIHLENVLDKNTIILVSPLRSQLMRLSKCMVQGVVCDQPHEYRGV